MTRLARVIDLEAHRERVRQRFADLDAEASVAADERATGAQLVEQWLGLATLYPDEIQRHLELLASAIDDAVEAAGSYEELLALLAQISNGARGEVVRIGRMRK